MSASDQNPLFKNKASKLIILKISHLIILATISLGLQSLWIGRALAGCTDPAGPAVDWYRCYMDSRSFQNADLRGARLREARFNRGDLSGSDMTLIDGRRAKFLHTDLTGALFDRALLQGADFTNANLRGASLKEADLSRARFFRANLQEADFTGADLDRADLQKADLSGARWIDGEQICAPGSIGQCN